jgi:hypothetical protein
MLVVTAALLTVFYQMSKKIDVKMLYAAIFLAFAINLLVDGVIMRGVRNGVSSRPFAERVRSEYPLDNHNTYVMNNLREYANLYGLNFYLGNNFRNFEESRPEAGYFFVAERDAEKVTALYASAYSFTHLTSSEIEVGDLRQRIQLFSFTRRGD